MAPNTVRDEVKRQLLANKNSLPYYQDFEGHRRKLTELLLSRGDSGSLCVLGAGNCFDLDVEALCQRFDVIHLVDLDRQALERRTRRLAPTERQRLRLHAPVDLSGCNQDLAKFRDMQVTPEHLMVLPTNASRELADRLAGPFDVVVSACLLSQMHLTARRVLGARHPLFDAVNLVLTLTHLRTLLRLTRPGGRAWFVTDVTSDEITPLDELENLECLLDPLRRFEQQNLLFQTVSPSMVFSVAAQDPTLRTQSVLSPPVDAWLWRNGPRRTFMVYACELTHRV
jgi:hypothetical protein